MRDREETIEVRDIYKTILSFKNQKCSTLVHYDDN